MFILGIKLTCLPHFGQRQTGRLRGGAEFMRHFGGALLKLGLIDRLINDQRSSGESKPNFKFYNFQIS